MTDLDVAIAVLESGTREEVNTFLAGLTARQRKALGPKFRHWLNYGSAVRVPRDRQALAVIATADGQRQARLFTDVGWGLNDEFVEDTVRILEVRSPGWLPDFVESVLSEQGSWNWRVARGIVRAGLVPEPDHPEYFRGTVRGVPDFNMLKPSPLVDQIRRDPGLIGDHLLTMLSTEGVGRLLAFHDSYTERRHSHPPDSAEFPAGTWRVALVTLVQEGLMERGRMIDTVLAAPLRDWAAADLGWYVGLHDALQPTLEEIAERQGSYARLLTVEHGPSVKAAQRELLRLMPDERFDPQGFLDGSKAILGRSDKSSVVAHLRILDRFAKSYPDVAIVDVVSVALDHPRADVRQQAATLMERLGTKPVPQGGSGPFTPAAPEARPCAEPVRPVESADELAEILFGLFEQVEPIEMERAIDGLLRFSGDRPSATELLLARASEVKYYLDDPRIAARVFTLAWLAPRRRFQNKVEPITLGHTLFPMLVAQPHTHIGAMGRRLTGIANAVRRGNHISVALPTSTDFTIEASELNRRLRHLSLRHPVSELELIVALLRVAPDARSTIVLPRALKTSTALRRIQDGQSPRWAREVATFQPHGQAVRRVAIFRDIRGSEGHAGAGVLARTSPATTVKEESSYGDYEPHFEQALGLGAALLPHDHDVMAAHAHPYLARDLRKDRACCVPVIDAIARARTANGAPSSSALVLALAAKDARSRIAAQDAILDLARYGVLDANELGRQAALLLTDDVIVGQRVSAGMGECARASDAVVLPILDALQEIVAALPGRRDAAGFLELAADLADRSGRSIDLPAEFRDLAVSKSTSMLAKAARRLLR